MAEVLTSLPPTIRSMKGHRAFQQYMDGQIWRLVQGTDFLPHLTLPQVRQRIHDAARSIGTTATCQLESRNPITVIVQARHTPAEER